ncbi:MAG: histidine kinase, partial [Saprospiraceae bacterium]
QSKPEYYWLGSFKVAKKTENNVIWTGQSTIAQIKSGNKFTTILPDRTYAVEPLTENYGWIGSVEGLYLYDNGKLKKYKQEKLHVDIRDIKKMRDGKLWVATKSEGVFILENDEIIQQLNIKNGFPSNDVKKLYEDDSFIWIATGNGIAYLEKGDTSLQTISVENGLPPGQINDIIRIKDQIILATNRGMVYFNPDKISFERPSPTLEIRSIRINEKDTLITNNYELEYYEDNIKVAFRGIAFQISQPPNYQIKMDGLDENWLENTSGQAEYPSLSPGKYTLNIRSKIIGSEWSEIKQIQFIIESPYWKKLWFFALLILGFILLFVSIGYRIYKGIERDAEIKNKLRTYQMTALRAQMNPHFMFNSLNSIQQFILTQDKRAANKYLSNFAKLMRSILEMSDKEKISLDSEIEALGLYLELENLRFDNELDYKIEIDDNIDPKTKFLPSMLIQPYVENAIKHGLMHKESDRKLHIYFCMENEFLKCMIDDNGIGRETSKQIQKENKRTHQAKAMGLTEERLELLNKSSKKQLNVIIEDKYDNHKNSLGTKVVLFIKQD